MRKLYSSRNNLSSRGSTTIKDEQGKVVYLLTGRWGMHPAAMSVYDIDGVLLAEIKQRSLGLLPKFELFEQHKLVGSLRRYYGVGHEMLFIQKLNWFILGNSLTFNYKIYHGRTCILSLHEVELSSGKFLELQITHQDDEPLCICVVAILDFWAKSSSGSHAHQQQGHLHISFDS
ncbi:hypothetical protein LB941_03135 [Ligilactobacillus sp. WILCCON 0076]|uniref:Uncharacterized protein n=1 Tax=Ligilactobacillus ubinensis TaxID=2876789 RepID=A0A9X2FIY9_9LACO|nr:hypothetical protein [Ligilactobacillus ubinensis]MCP0886330.1 hypothetical protein [Ligilactobacillus ubinensis]